MENKSINILHQASIVFCTASCLVLDGVTLCISKQRCLYRSKPINSRWLSNSCRPNGQSTQLHKWSTTSKRSVAHPNSSAVDADSQEASMPISSENLGRKNGDPFRPHQLIKFQAQAHSESQPLCIHEVFPKCASGGPKKYGFHVALTRFEKPNNQRTGQTQLEW